MASLALITEAPVSANNPGRDFLRSSLSVLSERVAPKPLHKQHNQVEPYPRPSPTTRRILPPHPELQKRREEKRLDLIEERRRNDSELRAFRRRQSADSRHTTPRY